MLGHDHGGGEHQRAIRLCLGEVTIVVREAPERGPPTTVQLNEHDRRFTFSHSPTVAGNVKPLTQMGNTSVGYYPSGTLNYVELIEMAWDDDAWDAFRATETTAPTLYLRLHAVLTRLAGDHGAHDLRRQRLQDPPLFVITVAADDESWAVLWNLAEDGVPRLWFVGPSPF